MRGARLGGISMPRYSQAMTVRSAGEAVLRVSSRASSSSRDFTSESLGRGLGLVGLVGLVGAAGAGLVCFTVGLGLDGLVEAVLGGLVVVD